MGEENRLRKMKIFKVMICYKMIIDIVYYYIEWMFKSLEKRKEELI